MSLTIDSRAETYAATLTPAMTRTDPALQAADNPPPDPRTDPALQAADNPPPPPPPEDTPPPERNPERDPNLTERAGSIVDEVV